MKPIVIFRHSPTEGPGYFADFLNARSVPWELIAIDSGAPVPANAKDYSGLVFMGGPMSVNDDLPWIPKVLELIRQGVKDDVPVLGHCLGGQLISKALGGEVTRNPTKEIGWGKITIADTPVAKQWFGEIKSFNSFHWHGETFSLPPGAHNLMSSVYCAHQGFAIGKHLGMQCHVEMTERLIDAWCENGQEEINTSPGPAVQQPTVMKQEMKTALRELHRVAAKIYDRWLEGVKR